MEPQTASHRGPRGQLPAQRHTQAASPVTHKGKTTTLPSPVPGERQPAYSQWVTGECVGLAALWSLRRPKSARVAQKPPQTVEGWAWLRANKTLFTNTGSNLLHFLS